jgi:acetyltransferase-like isoleucine patch superfamily enzyme
MRKKDENKMIKNNNLPIPKTAKIQTVHRKIGKNVVISDNVVIVSKDLIIDDNVIIGANTTIKGNFVKIGMNSEIKKNSDINVIEKFELGSRSVLCNCEIKGRNIKIGNDFFSSVPKGNYFIVGGGSCFYPKSTLQIGNRCTIHDVYINIAMPVKIGDGVGISHGTKIFTHFFWDSIFNGYPQKFERVEISNGCIIGAESFFLPGTKVGKNCVVAARSVITKKFPADCMIAGNPSKIIKRKTKEKITKSKQLELVKKTLEWYADILTKKGFIVKKDIKNELMYHVTKNGKKTIIVFLTKPLKIKNKENCLILTFNNIPKSKNQTIFNLSKKTLNGIENVLSDDLRDFLRKIGIRIFTDRKFQSLKFTGEH